MMAAPSELRCKYIAGAVSCCLICSSSLHSNISLSRVRWRMQCRWLELLSYLQLLGVVNCSTMQDETDDSNDERLKHSVMVHALQVPEVRPQGILTKRLTLVVKDGEIVECFYPVFPSDSDAAKVISFLKEQRKAS